MDARIQGRLGPAFTGLVNGLREARTDAGPRAPAALLERVRSAVVDRAEAAALPALRIAPPGSTSPPLPPAGATSAPVEGARAEAWAAGVRALADAAPDPSLDRLGRALAMLGDAARERDDLLGRARGELS